MGEYSRRNIDEFDRLLTEYRAKQAKLADDSFPFVPVDLHALREREFNYDWLVEKWWPVETQLHIFAAAKTGKSLLMLWVACNIALGRDAFTGEPMERHRVAYIDNEMTEKELQERINDMGLDFDELTGWLYYFTFPAIHDMDTELGGLDVLELCRHFECDVLMIDTLSRVVRGEENSNDTYRNFYNHTGRLLRANSIALSRLDHEGIVRGRTRGATAKNDDVDLVYGLEKRSTKDEMPGYRLTRTHARIASVSETIELEMHSDPLSIRSTQLRSWTDAALRKARELESLDVPIDLGVARVRALMRDKGLTPGNQGVLHEAIRFRKWREDIERFGLK